MSPEGPSRFHGWQPGPLEQRQVLEFARSLRRRHIRGTPGAKVLELAVGIDPEDLKRMEEAIEEGCERIEPDEW
ncbi:MAG: hypothetical protein HY347_12175 [candidate division NC10 bacterium]|nr:hypothetical protein [candidate division NC10 bacterium]